MKQRPSRRFFLAIRDGGARRGAVTFNSRARRRPICVVRAPITPDKVETIYLPSVGDAITRVRPSSAEGEERARARRWGQGLVEEVRRGWVEGGFTSYIRNRLGRAYLWKET